MCSLVIDTRESRLDFILTSQGIPHTMATLDVGDILIQTADGEPLLVAERKSHADFAASNTDGRYREQRARLMAVRGSGVAVLYILEGSWNWADDKHYGSVSEKTLKRLTTRLMLRYGLPVLETNTLTETAHWCGILLAQLTDDPDVFRADDTTAVSAVTNAMSAATAALHTVKKSNKTTVAAAMLSAIPGLGPKRIATLLESAGTIAALVAMPEADIIKILGPKSGAAVFASIHT